MDTETLGIYSDISSALTLRTFVFFGITCNSILLHVINILDKLTHNVSNQNSMYESLSLKLQYYEYFTINRNFSASCCLYSTMSESTSIYSIY